MSEGPIYRLRSHGLLSKWGFGDGDIPDPILDHLDENFGGPACTDWHATLRLLVRRHLLPALEQEVVVYDIETMHNPIRASHVNGVEIDEHANNNHITLTPECVDVSWSQIEAALRDAAS